MQTKPPRNSHSHTQLYLVRPTLTLVGSLAICLSGCAGSLPVWMQPPTSTSCCTTTTEPIEPLPALTTIPASCRRTSRPSRLDRHSTAKAYPLPPLPANTPCRTAHDGQVVSLKHDLQQLAKTVHHQRLQLHTAQEEQSQMSQSLQQQIDAIEQSLQNLQQSQAAARDEYTSLSQDVKRLEDLLASDRAENSRLLDEIIGGLEQALSSTNASNQRIIEPSSSALRESHLQQ